MTLRSRVTVAAGVAVAIAIAIASLAAWLVVRAQMYREIDDALESQATAMENRPGPPPIPTGQQPSDDTSDLFTDSYLQVLDRDGDVVSSFGERELPVGAAERAVATGAASSAFSTVSADGVSVRVYTATTQGGAVQLGRSLTEVQGTLSRLAMALAVVAVAGIGLAAVLGRATAAAATAPVQRLSRAAETVARTGDISHPIEVDGDDELGRLARSFNSMLGALGASIRRQRELVADASHELRTPVASIRTNVEVLTRSGAALPAEERSEILAEVVATTEEMSHLIADLLEVARDEETSGPAESFRLDHEVLAAVEQAHQMHPTVTVWVDAAPSTVVGSAPRVRRAVLNLVDNAAKWSPPGQRVDVTVHGPTVTVRDHGPGLPPDDLDRVFDRFYRSAAARGRPGSGLGLSIVRQVAEDHGGTVEATNTDRGALFTLHLARPTSREAGDFRLSSSVSATRLMDASHPLTARSPAAWDEHRGERHMSSTTPDQPAGDPPGEPPETLARPEPTSPKMSSARAWIAAGVLAALVGVVGVVLMSRAGDDADAATDEPAADSATGFGPAGAGGRGAFGEVTAIDGSTLTVESGDPSGSTTTLSVEASAETVITESVDGTVADLAAGDSVVVVGEETETGVAATSLVEGGGAGLGFGGGPPGGGGTPPDGDLPEDFEPPADAQPPASGEIPDGAEPGDRPGGAPTGGFTAGEIVSIDDTGLTVETDEGEQVQVTVSSSTTVTVTVERTLADIAVGDTISASGETDGSVVTAETIRIGAGGLPGAGGFPGAGGSVPPGQPGDDAS
jgi:two-component system sensor histidine kinase MprB